MPDMRLIDILSYTRFVKCPLCTDYIARDASVWAHHMENDHSGAPGSWDDTGIRGGGSGIPDTKDLDSPPPVFAHTCYGCGATFTSNANLLAHLLAVHGAS